MDGSKGTDQPSPKRWLGIGARILATLLFLLLVLALNRCSVPKLPVDRPSSETPTAEIAKALLQVEVLPKGAQVLADGLRAGTTPVIMELPTGQQKSALSWRATNHLHPATHHFSLATAWTAE